MNAPLRKQCHLKSPNKTGWNLLEPVQQHRRLHGVPSKGLAYRCLFKSCLTLNSLWCFRRLHSFLTVREHLLIPLEKHNTHLGVLTRALRCIIPFVACVYFSNRAWQLSWTARRQMNVHMWRTRATEFWIRNVTWNSSVSVGHLQGKAPLYGAMTVVFLIHFLTFSWWTDLLFFLWWFSWGEQTSGGTTIQFFARVMFTLMVCGRVRSIRISHIDSSCGCSSFPVYHWSLVGKVQ